MTLGRRVRFYREKLQLTLDDLSERSGVEVGTISALENRNSSRSQFTGHLAKAFGLTIEQLLDEQHDWLSGTVPLRNVPKHTVHQTPAAYDVWPIEGISREDFWKVLSATDRAEISGFAKGLLTARLGKRAAP